MAKSAISKREQSPRTRILTHINCDHQESLMRYLEHYRAVSSQSARNAILVDISFTALTIHTPPWLGRGKGSTYEIPFEPRMESWGDVRPRMAAMDQAAIDALGRSSVTIRHYEKPYGFMLVVMMACVATFLSFSRRGNFVPGARMYETLRLGAVPRFARFCYLIQPWLLSFMLAVHGAEAVFMARTRLRRHNVPAASSVWFMWVVGTFLEGFNSFVRFDRAVRVEEEKRIPRRVGRNGR
ncbi:MAG: hypothetical protein Q9163_000331 [Psora crenata]